MSDAELKDRRILGEEGFVTAVVVVDASTGKVTAGPEFFTRGFADLDDEDFDDAKLRVTDALADAGAQGVGDAHALQQVVRRAVGKWVNEATGLRPMIIPVVIEA